MILIVCADFGGRFSINLIRRNSDLRSINRSSEVYRLLSFVKVSKAKGKGPLSAQAILGPSLLEKNPIKVTMPWVLGSHDLLKLRITVGCFTGRVAVVWGTAYRLLGCSIF